MSKKLRLTNSTQRNEHKNEHRMHVLFGESIFLYIYTLLYKSLRAVLSNWEDVAEDRNTRDNVAWSI